MRTGTMSKPSVRQAYLRKPSEVSTQICASLKGRVVSRIAHWEVRNLKGWNRTCTIKVSIRKEIGSSDPRNQHCEPELPVR